MSVRPVRLERRGVAFGALRAVPGDGRGPLPGVLHVHDAWGLADALAVMDAVAAAGFVVLAPDLLAGRSAGDADEARALAAGLDPEDAMFRLATAADALAADPAVRHGWIGAVGIGSGAPFAAFLATIRPAVGIAILAGPVPDLPFEAWARAEAEIVVVADPPGEESAAGDPDEAAATEAALDGARAAGLRVRVVATAGEEVAAQEPAGQDLAATLAGVIAAALSP